MAQAMGDHLVAGRGSGRLGGGRGGGVKGEQGEGGLDKGGLEKLLLQWSCSPLPGEASCPRPTP